MKDTAISNPTSAINNVKGISEIIKKLKLVENSLNKKDDKIFSSEWPATILAKSLTPNETALAK